MLEYRRRELSKEMKAYHRAVASLDTNSPVDPVESTIEYLERKQPEKLKVKHREGYKLPKASLLTEDKAEEKL